MAIRLVVSIQGFFSGFVAIGRYGKWLTVINLLLILIRSPDGGTGRTCLGGGMHCLSVSSYGRPME